jgi:hypothetical protein
VLSGLWATTLVTTLHVTVDWSKEAAVESTASFTLPSRIDRSAPEGHRQIAHMLESIDLINKRLFSDAFFQLGCGTSSCVK